MKCKRLTTLVVFSSIIGTTFFSTVATPVFAYGLSDEGITTTHYNFMEMKYCLSNGYAFIPDRALKKYANMFLYNNDENAYIPMEKAENLTTLGIDSKERVKDFRGISQFKNLKTLNYSPMYLLDNPINEDPGDNAKNLDEISQLSNLKILIFESNVTNLKFLRGNTSLKRLKIKSNKLTDLSELLNLSNLEWVILEDIPYTEYNDSIIKKLKELHPDIKIEIINSNME